MVRIRIGDDERELTWDEWEQRVRQGRVPPDALVRIDAVTDGAFVPARSLETYQSLLDEATLAWQSQFAVGPAPLLTALLVGVQIRIFWFAQEPRIEELLVTWFTNWTPPALEDGETWRLLTMGLLHTELFHLVMNMLWLAYTGWNLERALGRANLLVLYGASVLGGSLLSMFASPETPSLGASGGIFGLVAASVTFGFTRPELLPARGRRVFGLAMLPYLVVMFWSGLMNEGTDNWSHLGGLVTGGLLAMVLDPVLLQRRRGWNRGWHLALAGGIAAAVAVLGLLGPRIHPLIDEQEAQERLLARRGIPRVTRGLSDDLVYRSLTWEVPIGWRSGVTAAGDSGFVSPSPDGERAWAVEQRRHPDPMSVEVFAESWIGDLRRGWPDAEIRHAGATEVAGWAGHAVRASVDDGRMLLEWRGAVRGLWALEEVWQVDVDDAGRLGPLRDRLRDAVSWGDPEPLAEARATLERNPRSRRGRAQMAAALAEVGQVEDAVALYEELVAEDPSDVAWYKGLLQVAAWYPARVPDVEALRDRALAAHPTPEIVVQVARGLEEAQRERAATGLLELGWFRYPGDRTLRRARIRRDLPVELEAATSLPRHLVVHPRTGELLPPEAIARWKRRPLTVAEAEEVGEAREQERERVAAEVLARLPDGDVVEPLLVLRYGAVPTDRAGAVAALGEELRTLALRGSAAWVPDDLEQPLIEADLPTRLTD